VEQLRALALLLALELGDLARLALAGRDDRVRLVLRRQPPAAEVAAGVETLAGGGEARLHQPVGLRLEVLDLDLAPSDERERRGLDAPERHGPVERSPAAA